MTDLLDLLREQEHAADPRSEWVHSVMPNMGYACGGDMIDGLPTGDVDGNGEPVFGPPGRWVLGGWGKDTWPQLTCPDCRVDGRRGLARRAHLQQAPVGHVCPPVDETDDRRCTYWQALPEDGAA